MHRKTRIGYDPILWAVRSPVSLPGNVVGAVVSVQIGRGYGNAMQSIFQRWQTRQWLSLSVKDQIEDLQVGADICGVTDAVNEIYVWMFRTPVMDHADKGCSLPPDGTFRSNNIRNQEERRSKNKLTQGLEPICTHVKDFLVEAEKGSKWRCM